MAPIKITPQDRVFLERLIATEADHKLYRSHPEVYTNQVRGVVDTVLNRVASPQYPDTLSGVINGVNQFSAINGPRGRNYTVYGAVEKVPDSIVPAFAREIVNDWVNQRISGVPSSVGGHLNFANPHASDASNRRWIDRLDGPRFGVGKSVHYHGTTAGMTPIEAQVEGDYYDAQRNRLPPGEVPQVATMLDTQAKRVEPVMPTPASQRPSTGLGAMPTPASERPAQSVAARQEQVLLPELAPALQYGRHSSYAAQDGATTAGRTPPVSQNARALSPAEEEALARGPYTPELTDDGDVRGYEISPLERKLPERASYAGEEAAPTPEVKRTAPLSETTRPMSYAGQDGSPLTASEAAALRVSPNTPRLQAYGTVDAPSIHPSESRVPSLPSGRQSYAGQETDKRRDPLPYEQGISRHQLSMADMTYAGQERGPVTQPSQSRAQLERNTPSYAGNDGPQYPLASSVKTDAKQAERSAPATGIGLGEPNPHNRRILLENQQSYAGQDRAASASSSAPAKAPAAKPAAAVSPVDVPKYITTTNKVAVGSPAATKSGVPLGEMIYTTSRDSKGRAEEGAATAKKIEERFKTVTVTKLNPDWVAAQGGAPISASTKGGSAKAENALQPSAEKLDHNYGLLGDVRQAIGLPAEGIGGAILGGIRNAFGIPKGGVASGWGGGTSKQHLAMGLQPVRRTPTISSGHNSGGGTHATAVNRSGSSAVTISSGGRSHSESSMDTNSHMNMDVYRANRETLGGNFTQSNIDKAISEGKTLYK